MSRDERAALTVFFSTALMRSILWMFLMSQLLVTSSTAWSQGTVAPEEAPRPRTPAESAAGFTVPDDLAIHLVVAEPQISQPLSISFDDRGRMWVLQYRQFPNPKGLKPIKVDHWLRTKYDKLPEPPPRGPKGNDRISIYEDTNNDGRPDLVKHFLTDLNLASGMALAGDGVYVAQPPYLLFYPDRNHDDVPDGDPRVLLKGFGMDDAHAFANSLTWGPDGWLYGAQGSTATARIRGIGFQQGVWRYHPATDRFELFAEGGGNTWGIDFDRWGNLFAGGNTVEPLVHHVQGAYYVKGFGKHGPLHNPHTYGYFQPVKHVGYAGDSLTGGFVLYGGGLLPDRFDGACIAPNTRHSASRWSKLSRRGSSFQTTAAGDFITSKDIWFRPVDSTVGPDGALYVADWYDYNISHSSPKNRSKWYQPSRNDGRVWRIAPKTAPSGFGSRQNLAELASPELVALLFHSNQWYSRQARRLLSERKDKSIVPELRELLKSTDQEQAIQALWAIHACRALDDQLALQTLRSSHPYVRAWTVRLLGDERRVSQSIARKLVQMGRHEPDIIVRSQLACTAKRLRAKTAIDIVRGLVRHAGDEQDVQMPLLLWWAIESKAISDTAEVFRLLEHADSWELPMVRRHLLRRLSRRLAAEESPAALQAVAQLLRQAPADADADLVVRGLTDAFAGRRLESVPKDLRHELQQLAERRPDDPHVLELSLRLGGAVDPALRFLGDPMRAADARSAIARALGETRSNQAIDPLLQLATSAQTARLRTAAIAALGFYADKRIARQLLSSYSKLPPAAKSQVVDLLCGRREWAALLIQAVAEKTVDSKDLELPQLRQLIGYDEPIRSGVTRYWGRVQAATPLEKRGRISAVQQALNRGRGDARRGQAVFQKNCAACHKFHGFGTELGPDLTGAERKDRLKLISNIVDPSAVIRQQYITLTARTADGRVLTGLLAAIDAKTVTLVDAKNKRTIVDRRDLETLRESPVSLMPDDLLKTLTDQQIRDLITYLQSDPAPKRK